LDEPDATDGEEGDEHERVARWVLDNLLNVGTVDRAFRAVYGRLGERGYQRHAFDFKLLSELASLEGEVYLRASDGRFRRRALSDARRRHRPTYDHAAPCRRRS
jgi:hypothetical protein